MRGVHSGVWHSVHQNDITLQHAISIKTAYWYYITKAHVCQPAVCYRGYWSHRPVGPRCDIDPFRSGTHDVVWDTVRAQPIGLVGLPGRHISCHTHGVAGTHQIRLRVLRHHTTEHGSIVIILFFVYHFYHGNLDDENIVYAYFINEVKLIGY